MAKILTIEVDSVEVRVAEVEQNRKKSSQIKNCFWFATPEHAVEDGRIAEITVLAEALRRELDRRAIHTDKVKFIVTSTRLASREVRIPVVKEKQIQGLLEANSSEYFPIDISRYVLSYSMIDIEENEGQKQYHLMVYAAPKALISSYGALAEAAKLQMTGVGSTSDSFYHAVKSKFADGTHFVMKIENQYTTILILRDGELMLQRNLNYGVDRAVEAMRTSPVFEREATVQEALELLRVHPYISSTLDGAAGQEEECDRAAEQAVTESLRYLIGNISRLMDYYISRNEGAQFDSITCCGLGARLQGLAELLSNEIGQNVYVLQELETVALESNEVQSLEKFIALCGAMESPVNLMEAVNHHLSGKENQDMRGAILILIAGIAGAVLLSGTGIGMHLYQSQRQKSLQTKIAAEQEIQEIYNQYVHTRDQYEAFQTMNQYTKTPNEQLVEFLEEMEQKLPSSTSIDTFSSDGTTVSFTTEVRDKDAAADLVIQLRTFESLSGVTTTGVDETEDGNVSLSVTCTYAQPAVLAGQE